MSHIKSDPYQTGFELAGSCFLAADFFLYVATPTVLMILDIIRKKEMTSGAISRKLGTKSRIVLDQLKTMEQEGIVVSRVGSKAIFYRSADSHMTKALEQILELPERKLKSAARLTPPVQGRRLTNSVP